MIGCVAHTLFYVNPDMPPLRCHEYHVFDVVDVALALSQLAQSVGFQLSTSRELVGTRGMPFQLICLLCRPITSSVYPAPANTPSIILLPVQYLYSTRPLSVHFGTVSYPLLCYLHSHSLFTDMSIHCTYLL